MWLIIFERPNQFAPDLYLVDPDTLPNGCQEPLRQADGQAIDQLDDSEHVGILGSLFAPPDMDPDYAYDSDLCGWMTDKKVEDLSEWRAFSAAASPRQDGVDVARVIRTGMFG